MSVERQRLRNHNNEHKKGEGGLVLTRIPEESIIINGDIRIRILEVDGNRVKLHIQAPKHIPIIREELLPPEQSRNH